MPCYQVNYMTVELNAADLDLLKDALKALGYEFTETNGVIRVKGTSIVIEKGKATFAPYDKNKINLIKIQYSKEAVKKASKYRGWSGTWTTKNGNPTITLSKW